MAQKLRVDLAYAKWFTQLLPLPGRVAVHGVDVAQVTISEGGVGRPARDSVLFCRYADHPVTLTLSAPGFVDITQEIPADPGLGEELFSVDMQDKALWSVDDAISEWTMLGADEDYPLILTARALCLVAPGRCGQRARLATAPGRERQILPAHGPASRPAAAPDHGRWLELGAAHWRTTISAARAWCGTALCQQFCEQQLTYHVGDLGCFAIQLGEDGPTSWS